MDDSRRSYETGQGAYGPTLRRGAGGAREGGGVQDGGERCRVPRHGWQTDVRHDAAESAARHERALSRPRFPLRLYRLGGERGLCRCRGGRSEEHTSELQSLMRNSYSDLCLKKKTKKKQKKEQDRRQNREETSTNN